MTFRGQSAQFRVVIGVGFVVVLYELADVFVLDVRGCLLRYEVRKSAGFLVRSKLVATCLARASF